MHYKVSYTAPHTHFIDIELTVENISQSVLDFQLPSWRPGRYELGNFAKNVQKWRAFDENENILPHRKITKDCWRVEARGAKTVTVKYNYYSAELNAGSTYLDEKQLYMNPVNCLLYLPERIQEECAFLLEIPKNYTVATSLKETAKNTFIAQDFHELADSPFIASNSLQSLQFKVNRVEFYLWFQGECKPEKSKLINDFTLFIKEQLTMMKDFPSDAYHFLFQIAPYKLYHGVEHLKSTVIALGPSYNLMQGDLYENLLGISSHELFHAWNIKAIRPVEMMPYDYTKENYSRLGYVCEGVTTYYGDLFLFRSGVFSEHEYFKTFNENLQKHFDNFGRYNLSVADSSFDTWLDGYVAGIPNRKTSIYTEGALCAFMADVIIRRNSANKKSLDHVMRDLYQKYGKTNKGYTEQDYQRVLEEASGISFNEFVKNYLTGTESYEGLIKDSLSYLGLELLSAPSKKINESSFGFKTAEEGGATKVTAVFPGSEADKAGLTLHDKIIGINNYEIHHNLNDWLKYFSGNDIELLVSANSSIKSIKMKSSKSVYYKSYFISKVKEPFAEQAQAFESWSKRKLSE